MTKLVQPNVLRAYQSGEQYAINELVLYNGVPAYTNTALAQVVAGTAGNFTNISNVAIELNASSGNQDLIANTTYYIPRLYTGSMTLTLPFAAPVGSTVIIRDAVTLINDTGSGIQAMASLTINSDVIQAPTGNTTYNYKGTAGAGGAANEYLPLIGGGELIFVKTTSSWFVSRRYGNYIPNKARIQNLAVTNGFTEIDNSAVAANTIRQLTMPNTNVTVATSKYTVLNSVATNQTLAIGGRYALPVGWNSTLALSLPTGTDGDTIEIADPYNVQRTLTGGNGVYVTPQVGQYIQFSTTTIIDIVGDLRSALAVLLTYSATNARWELSHISRNVPMNNTDNQEYYQDGALVRRKGCLYVPAAAFLQAGSFVSTEWVSLGVHKEAISANKTLIVNSSYYMRSASPSTPYTLTLPEPYTSISNSFDGAIIEIDCLEYAGVLTLNAGGWTNAAANGATNYYRQGPDYETDLSTNSRTIQCAKGMKIRFRKVQIGTSHYWFIDLGRPSDSAFSIADSADSTKLMGFNASAIAAGQRRIVTMPDANVNLEETTGSKSNGNTLSGTRTQILGGTNNNVSGTDNAAVNCTSCTISGTGITAINCKGLIASSTDVTYIGVDHTGIAVGSQYNWPAGTLVEGQAKGSSTRVTAKCRLVPVNIANTASSLLYVTGAVLPYACTPNTTGLAEHELFLHCSGTTELRRTYKIHLVAAVWTATQIGTDSYESGVAWGSQIVVTVATTGALADRRLNITVTNTRGEQLQVSGELTSHF